MKETDASFAGVFPGFCCFILRLGAFSIDPLKNEKIVELL